MKTTLYIRDNKGTLRFWSIENIAVNKIKIEHGVHGGSVQEQIEDIYINRSNRSIEDQTMLRMASRINNQLKKGYTRSLDMASSERATNLLGLKKPMLAQKDITLPSVIMLQYKYDGNRCLVTKQKGKMLAYSRNGKRFENIDHILEAASHIPEGTILDGEIYKHGIPLQTIRSWITRKQPETETLQYICYDFMSRELKNSERFSQLLNMHLHPPIVIAPTEVVMPECDSIKERLNTAIDTYGYEGLIARDPSGIYEDGKRSKYLIKIKRWNDAEYLVVDIKPSADNWGVARCIDGDGNEFNVSCPGTIEEKKHALEHKEDYIGRNLTVEFAYLTKDRIPFHPVAIAWR
jgi:DNA ligase-1